MLESTGTIILKISDEISKIDPDILKHYPPKENPIKDYGDLASELIHCFPWPVGVELQRLYSEKEHGAKLIQKSLRIFEKTIQFISFIMLCQVIEEKLKEAITIPEAFRNEFKKRFENLTMGDFVWLMKSLGSIFKKQNRKWFMVEMNERFNENFFENLNYIVTLRNDYVHNRIGVSLQEIIGISKDLTVHLSDVLPKTAFLVRYKLVYVKEIKVQKSKYSNASFHHNMDLLNLSLAESGDEFDVEKKHTDTNAVLLMRSTHLVEEFLNLSPLIIDATSEIIIDQEESKIPDDVYLCTGFSNGRIKYCGTNTSGVCTSGSLNNSTILEKELNKILSILI